jgi:hypothetical protein
METTKNRKPKLSFYPYRSMRLFNKPVLLREDKHFLSRPILFQKYPVASSNDVNFKRHRVTVFLT